MKILWMRAFLFILLCLSLVGCSQKNTSPSALPSSSANTLPSSDESTFLLPIKVSGKWGYVNAGGQLVVNPQFDYADDFHEGRAAVCIGKPCSLWEGPGDSRWGYIDTSGKLVVTPQYAFASSFSEGVASVCTGDCTGISSSKSKPFTRGYIDRDGKLVIPMQFAIAQDFKEGLAQVCIGPCTWEQKSGYNGKFGYIDHSGHFVINPQYDDANDFKNGFAKVIVGHGNDAKTGIIDKTGKTIWQPSN